MDSVEQLQRFELAQRQRETEMQKMQAAREAEMAAYQEAQEEELEEYEAGKQQALEEAEELNAVRVSEAGAIAINQTKISFVEGMFALMVALFIDAVQLVIGLAYFIPIIGWLIGGAAFAVGWAISIITALAFFMWLWITGVPFTDAAGARRLMLFGASIVTESIASFTPTWTLFVVGILIMNRKRT